MSSTREKLQKLADKLDEASFQRAYRSPRYDTYGKRRAFIASYLWEHHRASVDIENRDQLRRYFDDKYGMAQVEANKYGYIPSVWGDPERNDLAIKLFDVAITLENDGDFDQAYKRLAPTHHAGDRRTIIALACRRLKLETPHGAFYEQLRRYFDDTMGVNNCPTAGDTASYAKDQTIEFWLDEVRYPADCARHAKQPLPVHVPGCPIPIPSPEYLAEWQASQLPKKDTMDKPITITTTTFVNGADISKMADSEVFGLIASEEAVIEDLKKIKAQPKKLVAEIAKREAGIAALVAYLDSKEG